MMNFKKRTQQPLTLKSNLYGVFGTLLICAIMYLIVALTINQFDMNKWPQHVSKIYINIQSIVAIVSFMIITNFPRK